ncbi:DNA replication and repair protein RecF [Horticoccus luteus]|uniref:DNA replication and repair protein RecF n=1 Tax=Horticoccus luteus TaxID=2862869 RepID=A0A8F9TWL8_9BACT|nr:DNA replication and repair protein RecF [Horticoccus luteus]QYM79633.1 DNA replication and repair protein RecF [Horticoccus luteus]
MRLRSLTLRDFRNIPLARLEFTGRQQFFLGANGQGKTNLLEAAGFLTALRSFRAADNRVLIRHGQAAAAIVCELEHERRGDTKITVKIAPTGKELWCDQERVARLADYVGQFPTVVFSSQDLQLVRGTPTGRRRWLDLTLAAMDGAYLRALQNYTRAVAERNALLKRGGSEAELSAFEQTIAPAAADLVQRRTEGVAALAAEVAAAYSRVADGAEPATIGYEPNSAEATAAGWLERLAKGRARDRQFRSTLSGPHRDEVALSVQGRAAREFASEGQQRSLVLALRLAQAAWFHARSGVRPVLLADDVLGELDPARRRRFWSAVDGEAQVLATGTSLPAADLGAWEVFAVKDGEFGEDLGAGA